MAQVILVKIITPLVILTNTLSQIERGENVGTSKIYSKFDLKSGFHQVAMHKEVRVSQKQHDCKHIWELNSEVPIEQIKCHYCKRESQKRHRMNCSLCDTTVCGLCSMYYYDKRVLVAQENHIRFNPHELIQSQQDYIMFCEAEIKGLKSELEELQVFKEENQELNKKLIQTVLEAQNSEEEAINWKQKYYKIEEEVMDFDRLLLEKKDLATELKQAKEKGQETTYVLLEESVERFFSVEANEEPIVRKRRNMLYNLKVDLEISNVPTFTVNAILDTGATTCYIDKTSIPEKALETNLYEVQFSGITSKTSTNLKLRNGKMMIGSNTFRIPYTYSFPLKLGESIQMIVGCNFIRSMKGGVGIEGNLVTFYKNITPIETLPFISALWYPHEISSDERSSD